MAIRQFPDLSRTVYDIASLPFDAIDLRQAVARVIGAVQGRIPLFISTPNLNFLIAAQSDQDFRRSVRESDLSLADGMPIVWLARLLDVPIRQRVAGSDLFEALCLQTQQTIKVFFFGGPPGAAEQAGARVNARTHQMQQQGLGGGVQCVGFESPGFGSVQDMSTPDILQRINASGADFVVVALGARKGQAWIQHNRAQLDAPVICHLGAVVNMAAGTIARAPRWMRLVGLEWVWRIKEEPQLWRRYGADGLAMLRLLLSYVVPQMWGRWRQRARCGTLQPRNPAPARRTRPARAPGRLDASFAGRPARRTGRLRAPARLRRAGRQHTGHLSGCGRARPARHCGA